MVDLKAFFGDEVHNEMLEVLDRLRKKAMSGPFIYRGEPKIYPKVSSSLYRQCVEEGIDPKDPENTSERNRPLLSVLEEGIVNQAQSFLPDQRHPYGRKGEAASFPKRETWRINSEEYKILCQIQHYGGSTNLIDFTTDYFVALFFACINDLTKPGRVIFVKATPLPVRIQDARIQAQKSVFVWDLQDGFLTPDDSDQIMVPTQLKDPLLLYLKQCHDISSETLFPDIQGAVDFWNSKQSPRFHSYKAELKRKQKAFEEAIRIYDKCLEIELDPQVLAGRGISNCNLERWDAAHEDLKKAIMLFDADWRWQLRPQRRNWAIAHYMRGVTFLQRRRWDEALEDLDAAKEKGCNIATEFHNDFGGITAFEQKYELCLPFKIKKVLTDCETVNKT